MIPKDQLDAWRKLAEQEIDKPWWSERNYEASTALIAAARSAIPQLIKEVEQLNEEKEFLHAQLREYTLDHEQAIKANQEVKRLQGSHCKTCRDHWKDDYIDEMCEGVK